MKRIVIQDRTPIPPFGEPARDLRILNKPLWLLQRDLLSQHCRGALEVDSLSEIPRDREELLVHRDNLFFNDLLINSFIEQARASGHACQIAFAREDKSITTHALRLQEASSSTHSAMSTSPICSTIPMGSAKSRVRW